MSADFSRLISFTVSYLGVLKQFILFDGQRTNISELYHISGVRTRVQKVKPKMAEIGSYKTSVLVLCAVNVVTKTLIQHRLKNPKLKYSILLFLRA